MDKTKKLFPLSSLITLIALLSVTFLWKYNLILMIILIVLSIIFLLILKNKKDLVLYLICGMSGALAEAFIVFRDVWIYQNPDIIKIPIWLPFLWGIIVLFIKQVSIKIDPQQTKYQLFKDKIKKIFHR